MTNPSELATDLGLMLLGDPLLLCVWVAVAYVLPLIVDEPFALLGFAILLTPVACAVINLAMRRWGLA